MDDEPENVREAGDPGFSRAIFIAWFFALNCIWILMVINGCQPYVSFPMFLITVLVGGLYLVWRKRLIFALVFTVAATVAGYATMLSYHPAHNSGGLRALSGATSIESAVLNFETEYGVPPVAAERVLTSGPEGVAFLSALLGNEPESQGRRNSKGIRFLTVRETNNRKGGLEYIGKNDNIEGLFDPWGNPYVVILNTKSEGELRFNHGSQTVELPGKSVAVFSTGKDGVAGNSDDVRTWGN